MYFILSRLRNQLFVYRAEAPQCRWVHARAWAACVCVCACVHGHTRGDARSRLDLFFRLDQYCRGEICEPHLSLTVFGPIAKLKRNVPLSLIIHLVEPGPKGLEIRTAGGEGSVSSSPVKHGCRRRAGTQRICGVKISCEQGRWDRCLERLLGGVRTTGRCHPPISGALAFRGGRVVALVCAAGEGSRGDLRAGAGGPWVSSFAPT